VDPHQIHPQLQWLDGIVCIRRCSGVPACLAITVQMGTKRLHGGRRRPYSWGMAVRVPFGWKGWGGGHWTVPTSDEARRTWRSKRCEPTTWAHGAFPADLGSVNARPPQQRKRPAERS
jgi:hypothetical protein